jgi:hypothetical protein
MSIVSTQMGKVLPQGFTGAQRPAATAATEALPVIETTWGDVPLSFLQGLNPGQQLSLDNISIQALPDQQQVILVVDDGDGAEDTFSFSKIGKSELIVANYDDHSQESANRSLFSATTQGEHTVLDFQESIVRAEPFKLTE